MKHAFVKGLFRIAFSVAALALLFVVVDLSESMEALGSAIPGWVLAGFLAFTIGQLLAVARWQWVIKAQGFGPQYGHVLRANLAGSFASMFLPGIYGGDLIRPLVLASSDEIPLSTLYSTVAFERLAGVIAMLLLALAGLLLTAAVIDSSGYLLAGAVLAGGLVIAIALVTLPIENTAAAKRLLGRSHGSVSRFADGLRNLLRNPRAILITLAFSVLFQVCMIGMYMLMLLAVGSTVGSAVLLLIPLAWLASTMPVSINGLGVREGVLVFILVQHGVEQPLAAAAALLGVLPILTMAAIGGLALPVGLRQRIHAERSRTT